jgi:hypothetical protein
MVRPKKKAIPKSKKAGAVVETLDLTRFADPSNPEVLDLLRRLKVDSSMSTTRIVMTVREYLNNQPNPVRACNAILFKLGVNKQFKDEPRKARIYTFTAIEEAIKQGDNFRPESVLAIAETRNHKITRLMGPDFEFVDGDTSVDGTPKVKSKKDIVTEIFMANKDSPTGDIIKLIVANTQIEKSSAYSILYSVRKSLIV